jgi:hypothetical protein
MNSAFYVAITVKMGCSSVPSHKLILRYEYPVVLTTLNLKIPFQLNALFIFSMHLRPDHSCFVAYATEDTNGPACNVTSSSPDSKQCRAWEEVVIASLPPDLAPALREDHDHNSSHSWHLPLHG